MFVETTPKASRIQFSSFTNDVRKEKTEKKKVENKKKGRVKHNPIPIKTFIPLKKDIPSLDIKRVEDENLIEECYFSSSKLGFYNQHVLLQYLCIYTILFENKNEVKDPIRWSKVVDELEYCLSSFLNDGILPERKERVAGLFD